MRMRRDFSSIRIGCDSSLVLPAAYWVGKIIAPKMLYLFPVTGILPQTVVSNSGYLVPACASGCMTKILKGAVFASIVSRNLSHDRYKALNYQCYYSYHPDTPLTRRRNGGFLVYTSATEQDNSNSPPHKTLKPQVSAELRIIPRSDAGKRIPWCV